MLQERTRCWRASTDLCNLTQVAPSWTPAAVVLSEDKEDAGSSSFPVTFVSGKYTAEAGEAKPISSAARVQVTGPALAGGLWFSSQAMPEQMPTCGLLVLQAFVVLPSRLGAGLDLGMEPVQA
jgi:hypothetical protein